MYLHIRAKSLVSHLNKTIIIIIIITVWVVYIFIVIIIIINKFSTVWLYCMLYTA